MWTFKNTYDNLIIYIGVVKQIVCHFQYHQKYYILTVSTIFYFFNSFKMDTELANHDNYSKTAMHLAVLSVDS